MKWYECEDLEIRKGEGYCRRLEGYFCFKNKCRWIERCGTCKFYNEDEQKYEWDARRLCNYWVQYNAEDKSLIWRYNWDCCNHYEKID